MGGHTVLRIVARFIIPFILLYALYVQLHGEYSPGGGFQAGVIFASAFILFCLIDGIEKTLKIISINDLKVLSVFGVLLYIGTGFFTMLMGSNFLDYYAINSEPHTAQQIGIVVIELGVGITVFAAMMMIFALFVSRKDGK